MAYFSILFPFLIIQLMQEVTLKQDINAVIKKNIFSKTTSTLFWGNWISEDFQDESYFLKMSLRGFFIQHMSKNYLKINLHPSNQLHPKNNFLDRWLLIFQKNNYNVA